MQRNDLLVWMDLEMTSLRDAREDKIIEIAVVLTDSELNIVEEGPDIVIHAEPADFDGIPESARTLHEASGIMAAAAASRVTRREAEEAVLAFLAERVAPQSAPLCGNSIHMDRHFLRLQMRELDDYLFYRCVDVSTVKELARRWAPAVYEEARRRKGESAHRAKDDILASIEELRFYRGAFFAGR
ncbi:MAG: oligoribonuclease [Patescibacteria group bacterium]|nr:oligoribonuclease [Patescibacteria group bacterium]MDE1944338.1 oligoribonuclease [Patescibacteria group bacterium]MDE1945332.1 oligoribonuclease [Patescibacteria group bacterium]MDE2057688.1 oligoribonuclease [Patescibacteria group bacterium]